MLREGVGRSGKRTTNSDSRAVERSCRAGCLVFVDIETGGIELHRPIVQIAAIAVDEHLEEKESFEVKIQFDEARACSDALRRIHYRRADWKRDSMSEQKACWGFANFLRKYAAVEIHGRDWTTFTVAQLVCHNAEFDGPFLRKWFERLGVFMPASYRIFCTLQRAYWYFCEHPDSPPPDDFRLGTLCNYFGIPLGKHDAHEAQADVRATLQLYRVLAKSRSRTFTSESSSKPT